MPDFILRPAKVGDLEDIIEIWRLSFGDSRSLITALLLDAGLLENAVGAESGGRLRSCMFSFDGLKVAGLDCTYVYALCTHPDFRGRGLGRAVALQTARLAKARGAELVCLRPADRALEKWYFDILGATALYYAKYASRKAFSTCGGLCAEKTDASGYARFLGGNADFRLLKAQELILEESGGSFLTMDLGGASAAACAERRGEKVLVHELFCAKAEHRARALSCIAAYFSVTELFLPELCGENDPDAFCVAGCGDVERLAGRREIFFPFTLD